MISRNSYGALQNIANLLKVHAFQTVIFTVRYGTVREFSEIGRKYRVNLYPENFGEVLGF